MAVIAELEARLQREWDDATAAVYADALIAAGDPRGEVIAIDLHIANHGTTPELDARRAAKLVEWLGRPYPVRLGLVHDYSLSSDSDGSAIDRAAELVGSRAGEALASISIAIFVQNLPALLDVLARRPHPWLRRITIQTTTDGDPVPPEIAARLSAATPNLEELALRGDRIFTTPVHATVRTLRLDGTASIVVGAHAMPSVTTVDLALGFAQGRRRRALCALLNPRLFPAVRTLDLSRNEYEYPTGLERNQPVFGFIDEIEGFDRIRELVLPSLRGDDHLRAAEALLVRFPDLHIRVARSYAFAPPSSDRLRVAAPRPWPAPDTISSRHALRVEGADTELALRTIIDELEAAFDTLPADARAAWVAFWELVDSLPDEDDPNTASRFDAETLLRAMASLPDEWRCTEVARHLRANPKVEGVLLSRYWNW